MKTIVIGGLSPIYEWGCQRMLQRGLEWLHTNPDFDFSAYVYGICIGSGQKAKELDDFIMNDKQLEAYGVPGAMHRAVISHLAYIHKHGQEKWLEEARKNRPSEECFEFDGTMESCGFIPEHPPLSEEVREKFGLRKEQKQ